MRNLSVRKKILFGFSVTIVFLFVIILVVFFSNMRTASDLATEQSENALLGLNDEYVLHYWRARVEAAPLYTSLDVNAHDNAIHYIDLALKTLGRMDSQIVDYPVLQKYKGDLSTIVTIHSRLSLTMAQVTVKSEICVDKNALTARL